LLAAVALAEVGSYTARQAMSAAVRETPALVRQYRSTHHSLDGLEQFLHERFRGSGVIVHVEGARPPFGARFEVRRLRPGAPPPATLLAMQIKPMRVSFPGGEAVYLVDPASLQGLFANLGLFVLTLAVVVLFGAWRLAIVMARKTLDPLVRTTRALNRFGSGDFTPEAVSTADRTELGELARAYNRAVEQITRAFDEREKASAEMRQFVADAGHQLRTPLTVIMAYVSGMMNRPHSIRDTIAFTNLLQQSRRMKSLIDDLIMLARLEHPDAPSTQRFDLNAVCTELLTQFDEHARCRIRVSTAPLPAVVEANETDISFALCALVDNALKYAPQSDVEVSVHVRDRYAVVTVADRGPGMTPEDLRNAFDRFYRGSASEGTEGTGLGLPIVRKSVERAGGRLMLESREGGGLTCTILLNVQVSSKNEVLESEHEQRTYVYD
jgi:two-component system OmpR family sensor kinase